MARDGSNTSNTDTRSAERSSPRGTDQVLPEDKRQAENAAELARRVAAQEKLVKLARNPTGDPTYVTASIVIIGAVALVIVVALLYFALG